MEILLDTLLHFIYDVYLPIGAVKLWEIIEYLIIASNFL